MEYLVGAALALGVGLFTNVAGFDRDRSLYPVILVVVASYYDLFAVMGGGAALGWEIATSAAFILTAVVGFRTNLWVVVVALVGHGLLDWHHGRLIENAGVPEWWPMFCMSYDIAAGAYLAWRLHSKTINATFLATAMSASAHRGPIAERPKSTQTQSFGSSIAEAISLSGTSPRHAPQVTTRCRTP